MPNEPALIGAYGPSGHGKSTDMIYAFPRGLFIAQVGALKVGTSIVGVKPAFIEPAKCETFFEAVEIIKAEAKNGWTAIVLDDASLMGERTFARIDSTKSKNEYAKWDKFRDIIVEFCYKCRDAKILGVINLHERGGRTHNGTYLRGGPKLPTDLTETLPALLDACFRTEVDPSRALWPVCYRNDVQDAAWVEKDRYGSPDRSPMNLGELLRRSRMENGECFDLPRAPGLEWAEALVEAGACRLLESSSDRVTILQKIVDVAKTRFGCTNEFGLKWILRDVTDRAKIRQMCASRVGAAYGVTI